MTRKEKDNLIAASVTMGVVLILLLVLFFGRLTWDREALAANSIPEPGQEEELFLEPELLTEAGETETPEETAPAAPLEGEPEPAPEENVVVKQKNPDPVKTPQVEKVTTREKPSPVKVVEPKGEDEKKKATSAIAGKFSSTNGSTAGKFNSSGTGDTSVGISGKMNGRGFLGCPKPDVTLSNKMVVRVEVTVDASGHVTSASASGGGSAAVRNACVAAARQARWTEKKGATSTRGSITFTITPR